MDQQAEEGRGPFRQSKEPGKVVKSVAAMIAASGRSRRTLAKATGISEVRLAEIVDENSDPTYEELRALAKALKTSVGALVAPPVEGKAAVLFRSHAGIPETTRVSSRVDQILGMRNERNHLAWISKLPAEHSTRADAEYAAQVFRSEFFGDDQFSPLLGLPALLDDMGVIVLLSEGERIEGASAIADGFAFVFLSPRFRPRMLFTCAHELGHLVSNGGHDFGTVDEPDTLAFAAKSTNGEERYCDWFASSLLLPKRGVGLALKKFREIHGVHDGDLGDVDILFVSHVYGVSFFVAAKRCEDMGLLPRGGALALYRKLQDEHGSPEKRAAEAGLPERPSFELPKVPRALLGEVVSAIQGGELSIGKAASLLNVSIRDVLDSRKKKQPLPS
jgi:Zn-dependent peptidase ImmA (M78 family)